MNLSTFDLTFTVQSEEETYQQKLHIHKSAVLISNYINRHFIFKFFSVWRRLGAPIIPSNKLSATSVLSYINLFSMVKLNQTVSAHCIKRNNFVHSFGVSK